MKRLCLLLMLSVPLLASCVTPQQRLQAEMKASAKKRDAEHAETMRKIKADSAAAAKKREQDAESEKKFRESWCQEAKDVKQTCDEWMEKSNTDPAFEDYAAKHDLIHRMCSLEAEWERICSVISPFSPSLDYAIELRPRQQVLTRLYRNYENRQSGQLFRDMCCEQAASVKKTCDEWMEKSNTDPAFEEYAAKHDLIHRMCSLEAEWERMCSAKPPLGWPSNKSSPLLLRHIALSRLYLDYEER